MYVFRCVQVCVQVLHDDKSVATFNGAPSLIQTTLKRAHTHGGGGGNNGLGEK